MANVLQLKVVTTDGKTLTDSAVSVRAPGAEGFFGMLYQHAPLVSVLRAGTLSWRTAEGDARSAAIGEGLLEVAHNRITILTARLTDTQPARAAA